MTVWTESDTPHFDGTGNRRGLLLAIALFALVAALAWAGRAVADPPPVVSDLTGLPEEVSANQNYTMTVTLSGPAQGDTTVDVTYTGTIGGDASCVVPNGQTSANFTATTPSSGFGVVSVSASTEGMGPEIPPTCQALWID